MGSYEGCVLHLCNFVIGVTVFVFLLVLVLAKAAVICPIVTLVVSIGNSVIIIGLWPCHFVWTCYCLLRTNKFGALLKGLLIITFPILLLAWLVVGIIGSIFAGFGYGFSSPVIATFEAILESVENKLIRCFLDGTWKSVVRAGIIVRDFADVCYYSYFSVMDGLLESKSEKPTEIKLFQIPGCALAGILGVLVDVPFMTIIVLYKAPIMLFKGWMRLGYDLIGTEAPFSKTGCVPIAGLFIFLWPAAVSVAALAGTISSFFVGCYAAAVAYQENSTKRGLVFVIAAISLFDEYTNDLLSLREGSCFPRPKYRECPESSAVEFPPRCSSGQPEIVHAKQPPLKTSSLKIQELKGFMIWGNFFKACEDIGIELIRFGAIGISDLEGWQRSTNKIVLIGLPAYVFLQCFLRSIKNGSDGFLMRDGTELTRGNRPAERVFEWLFEPMFLMKEQLKAAKLNPEEEAYLHKLTLYCGDVDRVRSWSNGGVPPADEIRRAQLSGISRRLQGFCISVSRLPTFWRRFHEVVKVLLQEAQSTGRVRLCDIELV